MESITSSISRVIYGDSTAKDKPTNTDVEDRQSYQRGAESATGDIASDEPSSTKFNAPEHSTPMRHEAPDVSTTSYGQGGGSGFDAPSFEAPKQSGTAAAFPSVGASDVHDFDPKVPSDTSMPGEYNSPKTEKADDGFTSARMHGTGAPGLNLFSDSKPDTYDGSSTTSMTSKPTDTGIFSTGTSEFPSSKADEFGDSSITGIPSKPTDTSNTGVGVFSPSKSNDFGDSSITGIPSKSNDTGISSTGAGEFPSSKTDEFGDSSITGIPSKPSDTGLSGTCVGVFSPSKTDEFRDSSITGLPSKSSDIGLSSTTTSEFSPSKTDDFGGSSTPGMLGAGTSQFQSSSRANEFADSTPSLTSRSRDIESESRGPTDEISRRDTPKVPVEGAAPGENVIGGSDEHQRSNVSSANEPTAEANFGNTGSAMSSSDPAPKGVTGATGSGPGTAVEPSVGADPASGVQPTQKQQGGDRPLEEPEESASSAPSEPPQTMGPPGGPTPGGAEIQKESQGEGTGEKYVKSSGMAADGGDFDATKPGAGREAERLLEEKGIHHGVDPKPDEQEDQSRHDSSSPERPGKVSKTQKLKEKLHIGHKK